MPKVMISFLNCKLINNYVEREVIITQVYFPFSKERFVEVKMYSTKSCTKRKLFTRIYEVSTHRELDDMYFKLLNHYKACTCSKPFVL